jgi:hypothetical protein
MSQGRNVRWWRELDSNQRAQESRFTVSRFQPLTHLSKVTLATRARIERAIAALTVRCRTTWLSGKKLARVAGIEPATSGFVDRRSLIQLSYTRIDWCPRSLQDFRLARQHVRTLCAHDTGAGLVTRDRESVSPVTRSVPMVERLTSIGAPGDVSNARPLA